MAFTTSSPESRTDRTAGIDDYHVTDAAEFERDGPLPALCAVTHDPGDCSVWADLCVRLSGSVDSTASPEHGRRTSTPRAFFTEVFSDDWAASTSRKAASTRVRSARAPTEPTIEVSGRDRTHRRPDPPPRRAGRRVPSASAYRWIGRRPRH